MIKLKGIAASGGISIGKAYFIGREDLTVPKRKISHEDISREIYRLEETLIETRREIANLQRSIANELGFVTEDGKNFDNEHEIYKEMISLAQSDGAKPKYWVQANSINPRYDHEYGVDLLVKDALDNLSKIAESVKTKKLNSIFPFFYFIHFNCKRAL